jgi:ABC-type oligopeptide transport system substrate-binding subunit
VEISVFSNRQKGIAASQHIRSIMALLSGLWACGHKDNPASTAEVLRRGLGSEPLTLDPAAVTDKYSKEVLRDLPEG